jgi:hypothetical protein
LVGDDEGWETSSRGLGVPEERTRSGSGCAAVVEWSSDARKD